VSILFFLARACACSIIKGIYSFAGDEWRGVSDEAVDVIQQLMDPCVETRLTAKGLLDHVWLEGVAEQPDRLPKDKCQH
jgi:hypothetical protein